MENGTFESGAFADGAFRHTPVLLREVLEALSVDPKGSYIDGTAGGGGHACAVLDRLSPEGRLLAIDRDPDAVAVLKARLLPDARVTVARGNYREMERIAAENGVASVDGVLLDIGVSSHQLDDAARGFSYHADAPLDMRMSREGLSAADIVNTFSKEEIADILFRYGEEKCARRIAEGIVKRRAAQPIATTLELADVVRESVPAAVRRAEGHPARRTFQALRIAVNGELDALSEGLDAALRLLKPGGRLAVITFHSLEDRIVKRKFLEWAEGCICPKDFPVCVCGKKPKVNILYKRGLVPLEDELRENPRAHSARLRAAEKLPEGSSGQREKGA